MVSDVSDGAAGSSEPSQLLIVITSVVVSGHNVSVVVELVWSLVRNNLVSPVVRSDGLSSRVEGPHLVSVVWVEVVHSHVRVGVVSPGSVVVGLGSDGKSNSVSEWEGWEVWSSSSVDLPSLVLGSSVAVVPRDDLMLTVAVGMQASSSEISDGHSVRVEPSGLLEWLVSP